MAKKVVGEIIIDIEKCKGCELCIEACPKEAITLSESINAKGYQYAIKVNHLCDGCASCALVCPEAIVSVYRTRTDNPEVLYKSVMSTTEEIKVKE